MHLECTKQWSNVWICVTSTDNKRSHKTCCFYPFSVTTHGVTIDIRNTGYCVGSIFLHVGGFQVFLRLSLLINYYYSYVDAPITLSKWLAPSDCLLQLPWAVSCAVNNFKIERWCKRKHISSPSKSSWQDSRNYELWLQLLLVSHDNTSFNFSTTKTNPD
jgi:hypothetical protein